MKIARLTFDKWDMEEKRYPEDAFVVDPDSFVLTISGELKEGTSIELLTLSFRWDEEIVDEDDDEDWEEDLFRKSVSSEIKAAYVWELNYDTGYAEYNFNKLMISTEAETLYDAEGDETLTFAIDANEFKLILSISDENDRLIDEIEYELINDELIDDELYEEEDADDDYYDSDYEEDDDGYF